LSKLDNKSEGKKFIIKRNIKLYGNKNGKELELSKKIANMILHYKEIIKIGKEDRKTTVEIFNILKNHLNHK